MRLPWGWLKRVPLVSIVAPPSPIPADDDTAREVRHRLAMADIATRTDRLLIPPRSWPDAVDLIGGPTPTRKEAP